MAPAMQARQEVPLAHASYKPAALAAELAALHGEAREAERRNLIGAQRALAAALKERTPPWADFKCLVDDLAESLAATQQASSLLDNTRALHARPQPPMLDDPHSRPRAATDALREAARIGSNLDVLRCVRVVAELMAELRAADGPAKGASTPLEARSVGSLLTGAAPSSAAASSGGAGGEVRSLPASINAVDYMARARQIAAAHRAATAPPLRAVAVMQPIHDELKERHGALQAELQALVLHGVYGLPADERHEVEPSSQGSVSSLAASGFSHRADSKGAVSLAAPFLPQLPLAHVSAAPFDDAKTPSPAPIGFSALPPSVQDCLPQVAQALDILCGDGHACALIAKAARAKAHAVVEHAVRSEARIASPAADKKSRRAALFSSEAPSASQQLACAALNRISFHFLGILRRLSTLAAALDKEELNLHSAIATVHLELVSGFVHVLNLLLGETAGEDAIMEGEDSLMRSTSAMLLRRGGSGAKGGQTNPEAEALGEIDDFWASSPVSALLNVHTLNIYNLELMYCVLRQFATQYQTLFAADMARRICPAALHAYVDDLTNKFVRSLRYDLQLYVRGVVGNRAGSLLQPPAGGQGDAYAVPLPPYVEPLAYAVAVCIRIATSIPVIAESLGCAVAEDLLAILKQRSQEALHVARQWTDASSLRHVVCSDASDAFQGDTNAVRSPLGKTTSEYKERLREVEGFSSAVSEMSEELKKDCDTYSLLSPNEWKAIVRLVYGLNYIVDQLRRWGVDAESGTRWSSNATTGAGLGPLEKLRAQIGRSLAERRKALIHSVTATLKPVRLAVDGLERDVVAPAVQLLRAEGMLRCYCLAHTCLGEVAEASQGLKKRRKVPRHKIFQAFLMGTGEDGYASGSDETTRLFEFDEYGDRIPRTDVKGASEDEAVKSLDAAEGSMVEAARAASAQLAARYASSRACLSNQQQNSVVSGLDLAIAASMRAFRPRCRAVAVASRLLHQTLVVEDGGLAGECTAEQCRSLMYASGMM